MKLLKYLILLSVIWAFSLATVLADDDATSPYGKTQKGNVDKTQSMLSIALDSSKKQPSPKKEKLKIRIFNNSDAAIYVVEQNVFVDFHFQVKDSSGATVAPNQEFSKIMQNRMAWLHISRGFAPGEFGFYDVNLSKIYDFVPGQTYTIQAWRYFSTSEYGSGTVTKVSSNALQFVASQ